MSATISQAAVRLDMAAPWRWLTFGILFVLFYLGENYVIGYKIQNLVDERQVTSVISAAAAGTGTSHRPIVFLALAGFGFVCWLLRPAERPMHMQGWLPAFLIIFVTYAALSVMWGPDQNMTVRRVVLLLVFCAGAFGVAFQFSLRDLMVFSLFSGALIAVLALGSEIVHGLFTPWQSDYRLYGIMHANSLGGAMAVAMLAALALARISPERRRSLHLLALIFFGIVVLTKSRAAFTGLVVALWVWWFLGTTNRTRFVALSVLATALIVPVVAFVLGEAFDEAVRNTVFLGRDDKSVTTFTGRTPLWELLITKYVDQRPLLGYGFDSFWTARHVLAVSADQNWIILHAHSGFVNMLLDLGVIGLFLFVLFLIAALRRAYRYYRLSQDPGWLFVTALLTWAIVNSFADVILLVPSMRNFICMVAIAKLAFIAPRFASTRDAASA